MTLPTFTILDRLRKAREHAGLTQAAFAEKVGVSTVTYSRYESGARSVPDEVIERAAEATKVPVEWFYQDDISPDSQHQPPKRFLLELEGDDLRISPVTKP